MAITLNLSDNFANLVTKFNQLSATIDSDLDFRNKISVTDTGGDGSLSYSSSTGIITYTGPSASEVRAHISATAPVTFTSGVIAANDATTTTKGVASFSTTNFSVTSGAVSVKTAGIAEVNLVDDAVSRAKLKDEVSLIIYNSAGSALKTLYGAGS